MKSNREFVLGDIHGAYRALMECFEKADFNYKDDTLICLGDVCDGWPEVNKAIEELLKIDNLIYILGNHDDWALKWFISGEAPDIWTSQGGRATINSYKGEIPTEHIEFLKNARLYYKTDNKVFTHGGFNIFEELEYQDKNIFIWDRTLLQLALNLHFSGSEKNITGYDEIYLGHTPTINYGIKKPKKICEIYMMDTGAGWPGGVLSLMNIDTKEVFISTEVDKLYPGIHGRGF
jgi:serine/threonine protein phosphatase 1